MRVGERSCRLRVLDEQRDALAAADAGRGHAPARADLVSWRATVSVRRTPVAASGWPSAMAPPLTFRRDEVQRPARAPRPASAHPAPR
jgi:hypothetical protein